MANHLISFSNGTIGYFIHCGESVEEKAAQMLERCASLGMSGSLVDATTYEVLGRAVWNGDEWAYAANKENA